MSGGRRDRLIRIGSWFVIVFALLPAITYMGHWPIVEGHTHTDDESSMEEHKATVTSASRTARVARRWSALPGLAKRQPSLI